jgi:gas vesicle protein
MFSRVRIAIRFFFVGLAVGILLAPRSGEQTRRMLREKADGLLNSILDAASMGAGADAGADADDADATAAPTPKRATRGNGSGTRSRAKATAEAAEEAAAEAGI